MYNRLVEAKEYIEKKIKRTPDVAIVLGSGLGSLADYIQNPLVIDYTEIPNFPASTVEGHEGKLIIGELNNKYVLCMKGRFHFYEGYPMDIVTLPIRVFHLLGIKKIILTNAAGGLSTNLQAGSLMLINDHINFMGTNPLIGKNISEFGPRFPDMSNAYPEKLREVALRAAQKESVKLEQGVYAGVTGPYYFSKAELRMLITIGANAIGMSTVPETIVATHCGMEVIGISCITDSANPDTMHAPSHEEIVKVAEMTKPKFIALVRRIVEDL